MIISHKALVVSVHSEPRFYHTAVKHEHWRRAMDDEIEAMHLNNTRSMVPLPAGK